MNLSFIPLISATLGIQEKQVARTLKLLEEGATRPFISRYRKEATAGLNEVQIAAIENEASRLAELEKRKQTILATIEEQGKLTGELRQKITDCWSAPLLEDLYLPYKPKRRTRAEIAREKGLEPLAKMLMAQQTSNPERAARSFLINGITDPDEALKGARDIIAEWISENEKARQILRNLFHREAVISSRVISGKEAEGEKFRDYFAGSEPLHRCSSHRLLAIRRGEAEGILRVSVDIPEEKAIERLQRLFVRNDTAASRQVAEALKDSYKRLLKPAIETEYARLSKEKADDEAIRVFTGNLRQLLLAPPLGQKRVMGIDPGFRTGCKVVCLDAQGNLLHNETIFPHPPRQDSAGASRKIVQLVSTYAIEAIAIGNGTAGRETEQFITGLRYDRKLQVFSVSENGASVYSASKVARDEFPDYDVTVRGAVSIGRRLIDPLAELVKIDPKSIGVGQYQHDVDQGKLKKSLDQTVESCVNAVGVNVNTASYHLLSYVSGLGPQLARNITEYRKANGPFKGRRDLLKVPRMGEKAFEQAAGFLRIPQAENPLDNSAVHPESYGIVERMAADLGCQITDLIGNKERTQNIDLKKYVSETAGLPTLLDILEELNKPGRDPRDTIRVFEFDPAVRTLADLREGMILPGIITNITNFGCFVDIGIKENGLVHISQITDRYISDPAEVVTLHQQVKVKVIGIDTERKRVQLSMKEIQ